MNDNMKLIAMARESRVDNAAEAAGKYYALTVLLADALEAANTERDDALAAIERVRAIHRNDGPSQGYSSDIKGGYGMLGDCCAECGSHGEYGVEWPCPTVAALDGAPEAATTEPEPNQYAPCFINSNRNLSILGTVNSVREYAEKEAQMLRDNEAAYPNGTPEAIVLAARYVGPWIPVEGEKP